MKFFSNYSKADSYHETFSSKALIEFEYEKHFNSQLHKFLSIYSVPLIFMNGIVFILIIIDYNSSSIENQLQNIFFWNSLLSLLLSILFKFIYRKFASTENSLVIGILSAFFSLIFSLPFQTLSSLLSTRFYSFGDPVRVIISIETILQYIFLIKYITSFKLNSLIGLMKTNFLWSNFFIFDQKMNSLCYSITMSTSNLGIILFSYYYEQIVIENFFISRRERDYFLHLFDKMNNGILVFKKGKLVYFNNFFNNFSQINQFDCFSRRLEYCEENVYLFFKNCLNNLDSINVKLSQNFLEKFLNLFEKEDDDDTIELTRKKSLCFNGFRLETILEIENFFKEFAEFSDFQVIGNVFLKNLDKKFQLLIKCHEKFEVLLIDITSTCQAEKIKAESKFNSLYLSKIAHEFKNPLMQILSLTSHEKDETADKIDDTGSQKQITNLCNYLLFLIEDLEYFSKSNKKSQNISPQSIENSYFDILKSLEFSIKIFKIKQEFDEFKKQISIKLICNENLPMIYGSEIRIKQVIINLLSNSYKFTINGFINLTAQKIEIDNNTYIRISVEDSGCGMNQDEINQIMNTNDEFPLKNIRNYVKHGSGIGLRIVKDITEKEFKSNLKFESQNNKGTKCWFDIKINENSPYQLNFSPPLLSRNKSESDISTQKIPNLFLSMNLSSKNLGVYMENNTNENEKKTQIEDNHSKCSEYSSSNSMISKIDYDQEIVKILVCDDDSIMRKAIIKLLQKVSSTRYKKLDIVEANNGLQALSRIYKESHKNKGFDLIIIDETMPVMRGSLAIYNIKSMIIEKTIKSLKICSLTAYNDDDTLNFIIKQGADLILNKPPTYEKIDQALDLLEIDKK